MLDNGKLELFITVKNTATCSVFNGKFFFFLKSVFSTYVISSHLFRAFISKLDYIHQIMQVHLIGVRIRIWI